MRFLNKGRGPYQLLLIGALLCALTPFAVLWGLNRPTEVDAQQFRLERGMHAASIGAQLQKQGLIRSAAFFQLAARLQRVGERLEAGVYRLDGDLTTIELLGQLQKAPMRLRRVTLPEGWTLDQVAGAIEQQGLADSARLVALANNSAFIASLGIKAPSLEGYLFPETYLFEEESSEAEILTHMIQHFDRVFATPFRQQAKAIDLSLHQIVTLASIIEREAVVATERPIISSVFHRRLQFNRRLESCATVEYALGVHKVRLSYRDLEVDSPYNTYQHRGLPPGPIGNPGLASLKAALNPAETPYLYFVARGDGTHIFSKTNKEHNRAKHRIKKEGGGRIN
jgi:UPF0755 protein